MKLHRFIGDFDLSKKIVTITDRDIVKQVRNVLKLEIGEHLVLSDGKGLEAKALIKEIFSAQVNCEIIEINEVTDSKRIVSLYLAVLKKDNFELAVQKATECGVAIIIPVITERTIKTGLNMERLEKIVKEASEQSGRSLVPEILKTMTFNEAIEHGKQNQEKIIFHLVKENYESNKNSNTVSIFIGPEGGFTEKEITTAKESGYDAACIGDLTLRGETAAIIATYRAVQGI